MRRSPPLRLATGAVVATDSATPLIDCSAVTDFTPLPSLLGGVFIGLAAALLLVTHGRVAGISGLYAKLFTRDRTLATFFVLGLALGGAALGLLAPGAFAAVPTRSLGLTVVAGVLVGFGTRLGGGCTSGHGVCGIGRFSKRSIVATCTFMATAFLTVFLVRP